MTWDAERKWVASESFPYSRNRVDQAGRRARQSRREGREIDEEDLRVIDLFRGWHLRTTVSVEQRLKWLFHDTVGLDEEECTITSRPKTLDSILAKLRRSTTSLIRMQDIAGARIVLPSLESQDAALSALGAALFDWNPQIDDQRDRPAEFSYRAVHVIVRVDEAHLAEIQIRTRRQDVWAQIVERLDKDHDWDLKHGGGPAEWLEWLHDLSDALYDSDRGLPATFPPSPFDLDEEEPTP